MTDDELQKTQQAAYAKVIVETFHDLPSLKPPPRVKHKVIWEVQIPAAIPAPDSGLYHRELERVALQRVPNADALELGRPRGDPMFGNITAVGRLIYYGMCTGNRLSVEQMAARLDLSAETVRLCIRFLEDHGMFGILNPMKRWGQKLRRAANLYVAPWFIDLSASKLPRLVKEGAANFLADCGKLFGLAMRPLGLNTTPLRQPGRT